MTLHFGGFTLDTETFELRDGDSVRAVQPMVFDLIAHLAEHPGRVFSRDELIEAVWEGRCVSDATVSTCVKNARKALARPDQDVELIKTVRGRGFRFVAPPDYEATNRPAPGRQTALSGPRTTAPSMAVLPFRYRSDDLELQRFTSSLSLDLSTILTRIPLLRISAETDLYYGQDPLPSVREIHRLLGVDFVVDGSVRDTGGRVSATLHLSNARTGYRLWAESFDLAEPLTGALEDCIAEMIGKLEPQIQKAMYLAVRSVDEAPSAQELFVQANGLLVLQGWNHESFAEASEILERSAELDPEFALAPALLSLLIGFGSRLGLEGDRDTVQAETARWADRALRADSMDSTVLGFTGCSLADVGYAERGEALLRNALDLNPANAQAWVALGGVKLAQLHFDEAVDCLSRGIQISPVDSRLSVWGALLSVAHLLSGNLDQAIAVARTACQRNDRTYLPRVALAGALLAHQEIDASRRALADARRIKADLTQPQIAALLGHDLSARLVALEKRTGPPAI